MIRENRSHGRQSRLLSVSTACVCAIEIRQTHTHEEVVSIWNIAADTEQLHKIMELAVDVTANLPPSPVSSVSVSRST
jgi:hypothetical protein